MSQSVKPSAAICIHEDRSSYLIGVKLAVLSLLKHCPTLPIVVSCPEPPASFRTWIDMLQAPVTLVSYPELKNLGWNVKPAVLLRLFEAGYAEIIWVDSDIIATGDILSGLLQHSADTLIATQEHYWGQCQGEQFRTRAWGLTPDRNLFCAINTGILRVTTHHIPLLKAWEVLLNYPFYVRIQGLPWHERPVHMVGDQDVLTALMGSTEFTHIPIVLLKRGTDIAQCFSASGFTPVERLKCLFTGLPPLVHAMGAKPWTKPDHPPALWDDQKPFLKSCREYHDYVAFELSPYLCAARQYRMAVEEDTSWMETQSRFANLMKMLTGSNPILQDFPLSLLGAVTRRIRRYLKIARYSVSSEYCLQESPLQQASLD